MFVEPLFLRFRHEFEDSHKDLVRRMEYLEAMITNIALTTGAKIPEHDTLATPRPFDGSTKMKAVDV